MSSVNKIYSAYLSLSFSVREEENYYESDPFQVTDGAGKVLSKVQGRDLSASAGFTAQKGLVPHLGTLAGQERAFVTAPRWHLETEAEFCGSLTLVGCSPQHHQGLPGFRFDPCWGTYRRLPISQYFFPILMFLSPSFSLKIKKVKVKNK